jgi:hypothetical protein
MPPRRWEEEDEASGRRRKLRLCEETTATLVGEGGRRTGGRGPCNTLGVKHCISIPKS